METSDQHGFELVDTHIHLWDLSTGWYPAITEMPDQDYGIGDMSGLKRDYLIDDYLADTRGYRVRKAVHVTAVTRQGTHLAEAAWLRQLAADRGFPHAIIGYTDATADVSTIERELDEQAAGGLLRGVRVLDDIDYAAPGVAGFLGTLGQRGLVYDAVAHPDGFDELARAARAHPSLRVVLEHTGWPLSAEDFEGWRRGMSTLAAEDNVACKISGLGMTLGTVDAQALLPWVEHCLEAFGADRCVFGSNFPVDALHTEFAPQLEAYRAVIEGYGPEVTRKVFVTNAERIYGL